MTPVMPVRTGWAASIIAEPARYGKQQTESYDGENHFVARTDRLGNALPEIQMIPSLSPGCVVPG